MPPPLAPLSHWAIPSHALKRTLAATSPHAGAPCRSRSARDQVYIIEPLAVPTPPRRNRQHNKSGSTTNRQHEPLVSATSHKYNMSSGSIIHDTTRSMRERMEALVRLKQREITDAVKAADCVGFHTDTWERAEGGGGQSMVLQNGQTFEKGGVNISVVHGTLPPQAVQRMRADHKNLQGSSDGLVSFFACGLLLVIHPHNPFAPTTHLNYRYFETTDPETGAVTAWWFGGGADLTPAYLDVDDAVHFHATHKQALDKHDALLYPKWKKWCDKYFYIKHRQETRGVGGIFFDDFDEKDPNEVLRIVESCFDAFIPAYIPLVEKHKNDTYTPEQKNWQQIRRGRYVEFNLVLDRGTQFGLQTPGSRVESILMSLPSTASWVYDHHPEPGSEEEKIVKVLKEPVDWV